MMTHLANEEGTNRRSLSANVSKISVPIFHNQLQFCIQPIELINKMYGYYVLVFVLKAFAWP